MLVVTQIRPNKGDVQRDGAPELLAGHRWHKEPSNEQKAARAEKRHMVSALREKTWGTVRSPKLCVRRPEDVPNLGADHRGGALPWVRSARDRRPGNWPAPTYLTPEEPVEYDTPEGVFRKMYLDCESHTSNMEGSHASNTPCSHDDPSPSCVIR